MAVIGFVVIALAGIALMAYSMIPIRMCLAALPTEARAGVVVKESRTGKPEVDITAGTNSQGTQNRVQGTTFQSCIDSFTQAKVVNKNIANIDLSSLGQVANHWREIASAFQVRLLSAKPEQGRVLQNFSIGPADGHKADILTNWCQDNAACVVCRPQLPNDSATSVQVTLRADAPLVRLGMASAASAVAATPPVPYEDIEAGVRYLYHCQPSPPSTTSDAASAPASGASR
jgi:hypothetical protein